MTLGELIRKITYHYGAYLTVYEEVEGEPLYHLRDIEWPGQCVYYHKKRKFTVMNCVKDSLKGRNLMEAAMKINHLWRRRIELVALESIREDYRFDLNICIRLKPPLFGTGRRRRK